MKRWSALLALVAVVACRQDMHDQPKYEPLEASTFFADGRAARPVVPGTIARGQLHDDAQLYTGRVGGKLAETFPFAVTREVLDVGRAKYGIFCAPCHDAVGNGEGAIVQRGMKRPPSLHIERLRSAPPGHFFDVISNGFGMMFDYSDRIAAQDRWAIVAYVRALQLSQNATLADVPASERPALEAR